jgi:hypothetical protein
MRDPDNHRRRRGIPRHIAECRHDLITAAIGIMAIATGLDRQLIGPGAGIAAEQKQRDAERQSGFINHDIVGAVWSILTVKLRAFEFFPAVSILTPWFDHFILSSSDAAQNASHAALNASHAAQNASHAALNASYMLKR